MRVRSTTVVALVVMARVALSAAQEGPFGFERGMTKAQVERRVGPATPTSASDAWTFTTAPKPNPHFDFYVLFFSPTQGLLKVVGSGKDIETEDTGSALQSEFDVIVAGVKQTFGAPEHLFNFCNEDTMDCSDDTAWMLGLKEKNRTLSAYWNKRSAPVRSVTMIDLEAKALGPHKGWCVLGYEFEGWNAYLDMLKANESKSF